LIKASNVFYYYLFIVVKPTIVTVQEIKMTGGEEEERLVREEIERHFPSEIVFNPRTKDEKPYSGTAVCISREFVAELVSVSDDHTDPG
jgi:hypothetical protein